MITTASRRTTVQRHPERGAYDRAVIDPILDEGLVCHVGFSVDGQPYVVPTVYARLDDTLILHGSHISRMLTTLSEGIDACVTITLVDGVVLARSAFNHSMNYRSVMVLGRMQPVTDREAKEATLRALVDRIVPGRSDDIRGGTAKELRTTIVLSMPIREASAKIRTGPPKDGGTDLKLDVWAGVIPFGLVIGSPDLKDGIEVPEYVREYAQRRFPEKDHTA
jgi:uncharacterized protein